MLHLVSEQWFSKDFWALGSELVVFRLRNSSCLIRLLSHLECGSCVMFTDSTCWGASL